jgi:glutathione S-transferase
MMCKAMGVETPKPSFMPTFFFQDGGDVTAHCDSTPIIRRLEAEHVGRSVLPEDPALAFIDYLIEGLCGRVVHQVYVSLPLALRSRRR